MYLDPGSGSMFVSAALAGVAGVGVVAKTQWRRIAGGLKGGKKSAETQADAATETEQQQ